MVAHGRLLGQHDAVRAVQDGVGHVRGFRAGRDGIFDHGKQHLCGHDDRALGVAAGADDLFLDDRQLRDGALQAKVAARHHDRVRDLEDLVQVVHGVLPFELGDHGRPDAVLLDLLLGHDHVARVLHERDGQGVHTHFEALVEVLDVLGRQRRQGMVLAGKGDALVRRKQARVLRLDLVEPVGLELAGDVELEQAVAQVDGHAHVQAGEQLGHVERDEHALVLGRVGALVGKPEQQALALVHGARRVGHLADAGFRAAQVAERGQRNAEFPFQGADGLDDGLEIGGVGMGEVETEDAHAVPDHFTHDFRFERRGTQGGHDLGVHACLQAYPARFPAYGGKKRMHAGRVWDRLIPG